MQSFIWDTSMVNILLQTNIIKWRRTLLNTHVTEVSPNGMRTETISIPKSDQHLISPNSIIPGSSITNMRIM